MTHSRIRVFQHHTTSLAAQGATLPAPPQDPARPKASAGARNGFNAPQPIARSETTQIRPRCLLLCEEDAEAATRPDPRNSVLGRLPHGSYTMLSDKNTSLYF